MMDHPGLVESRPHSLPVFILDDLSARFLINIPEVERQDLIRVLFQIELAHWFYQDEYAQSSTYPDMEACSLREFCYHMFNHVEFLNQHANAIDEHLEEWKRYKLSVPTYGAIILNSDLTKVLLVQGYYASKNSWGFPKGKVNEDEKDFACATREVLEEIGFNIEQKLNENYYISCQISDQLNKLYIIPNVSDVTIFAPKTKYEIRDIRWFYLDDLPLHKSDLNSRLKPNGFYMVMPFVRTLRKWVNLYRQGKTKALTSLCSSTDVSYLEVTQEIAKKGQYNFNSQERDNASKNLNHFMPEAWKNFKFDLTEILTAVNSAIDVEF